MQQLWGRILAGEIKRSGAFSLRALDLIRNLSKTEAQLFERVCNWAISTGEFSFVANVDGEWLQKHRGTYFLQFVELADLGLLFPNPVDITLFANQEQTMPFSYVNGETLVFSQLKTISPLRFQIWKFTKVGAELVPLALSQGDEDYLDMIGRFLRRNAKEATIGRWITVGPSSISFTRRRSLGLTAN
jgi:hypothetical protein